MSVFCDCKKFNSVRNLFNLSSKLITAVPRRINLISVPDKIHKKRNWIVGNFLKQSQQTCNTQCPGDWVSDLEQTQRYNYIENSKTGRWPLLLHFHCLQDSDNPVASQIFYVISWKPKLSNSGFYITNIIFILQKSHKGSDTFWLFDLDSK